MPGDAKEMQKQVKKFQSLYEELREQEQQKSIIEEDEANGEEAQLLEDKLANVTPINRAYNATPMPSNVYNVTPVPQHAFNVTSAPKYDDNNKMPSYPAAAPAATNDFEKAITQLTALKCFSQRIPTAKFENNIMKDFNIEVVERIDVSHFFKELRGGKLECQFKEKRRGRTEKCKEEFKRNAAQIALKSHIAAHLNLKFTCSICAQVLATFQAFNAHVSQHSRQENIDCD